MDPIQTPQGTEPEEQDLEIKPAETHEPTPPTPEPIEEPKNDYEKKFSESTRENQILQAQLEEERKKNARRELTKEPTDSELRQAFPDWDEMTPTEQRATRIAFQADKRSQAIVVEREAEKAEREWNEGLEDTVLAHPELDGKETAFKDFAKRPSHRGAPMDVLVDAFLHKSGAPSPAPKPKQGLEPANGGPRASETKPKYTAEEMTAIQKSDSKKYREMLLAGEFD
jgi:hypothetical protein